MIDGAARPEEASIHMVRTRFIELHVIQRKLFLPDVHGVERIVAAINAQM